MKKFIPLECCEPAKLYVRLDFTSDTALAFDLVDLSSKKEVIAWIMEHPPMWTMLAESGDQKEVPVRRRIAIRHCPFCGTEVPKVEPNPNPRGKISIPVEAGYCSTCKNRLMGCTCSPLQFLFRAKR